VGYPLRLGYGIEEVAVGVVIGVTVMGIEVRIVEPWAFVVVKFTKEVVGAVTVAPVPEMLLPEGGAIELVGSAEESRDCAAEGGAAKTMRMKGKREWERNILFRKSVLISVRTESPVRRVRFRCLRDESYPCQASEPFAAHQQVGNRLGRIHYEQVTVLRKVLNPKGTLMDSKRKWVNEYGLDGLNEVLSRLI
jgi:hypothetical protein